ncbi:MAG: tetratricopeptide repeat protein [Dehalococcoidia bacterium]
MTYQTDDRARMRRQLAEQAINLAMESKWEDATQINRHVLSIDPRNVDAYNRLGKALTELGRYGEARAAYSRTLELDGANSIAKKNLSRLQALGDVGGPSEGRQKVDPDLFIEETGKTGTTQLQNPDAQALKVMAAGDLVLLRERDNQLQVIEPAGSYLGTVEPRLALRLINFMKTGNQYAAAIAGVSPTGDTVRVIIKETLQSAENAGKLSFPATAPDGFRAYTKDSLLRHDVDDDEADHDDHDADDSWEASDDSDDAQEISFDFKRAAEARADQDDEFEE